MLFSFDSELAQRYGVNEAIFLHNLYYWTCKNREDAGHWHDGRCWTYNSAAAFARWFPFWSRRQVDRIIDSLRSKGAVHIGRYNASGYDRTRWFALDQTVLSIYANRDIHFTDSALPFPDSVTPIPNRKPKRKPNSKPKDGVLPKQDGTGRYDDDENTVPGSTLQYGRVL